MWWVILLNTHWLSWADVFQLIDLFEKEEIKESNV